MGRTHNVKMTLIRLRPDGGDRLHQAIVDAAGG